MGNKGSDTAATEEDVAAERPGRRALRTLAKLSLVYLVGVPILLALMHGQLKVVALEYARDECGMNYKLLNLVHASDHGGAPSQDLVTREFMAEHVPWFLQAMHEEGSLHRPEHYRYHGVKAGEGLGSFQCMIHTEVGPPSTEAAERAFPGFPAALIWQFSVACWWVGLAIALPLVVLIVVASAFHSVVTGVRDKALDALGAPGTPPPPDEV